MRKIVFLVILHICANCNAQTVTASLLKQLDLTDPIDKIISVESQSLDTLIFQTPVWLSDELDSQYSESFGVIINKRKILEKIAQNHLVNKAFLIRLIIAHEKMHARQLAFIKNAGQDFKTFSIEQQQLMECQADMCAGYAAFFPEIKKFSNVLVKASIYEVKMQLTPNQNIAEPGDEDLNFAFNILEKNNEGIKLFFELGENEGSASHPDALSRKIAFEMGYNAFLFSAMSYPNPLVQSLNTQERNGLNIIYTFTRNSLGILPTDFTMGIFFDSWSNRTSRQVVHFFQKASKNIFFTLKNLKWNTDDNHPFLNFELEVENKNPDAVFIEITVPIRKAPRLDRHNPLKRTIVTGWHSSFYLSPGEKKKIVDSTIWAGADNVFMPTVSFPGENGSLYSVNVVNPALHKNYFTANNSDTLALRAMGNTNEEETIENLMLFLPSIQRQFSFGDVNDLKVGAGFERYDPLSDGEITYCCFLAKKDFELVVPKRNGDPVYLRKIIRTVKNSDDVRVEMKRIVDIFKSTYPAYTVNAITDNPNYPVYEVVNAGNEPIFTFSSEKSYYTTDIVLEVDKD
jgi:hypothetical protein